MPAAKLYAIPASHPCAAVEAALRLKGVDYERVELIPVAAKLVQWRRFHATTVPGVEFADGERVVGSRQIIRALEHRAPEPHLLPLDANERREVEEAEKWGDQVLQPLARRLAWASLKRAPGRVTAYSEGAKLPVPAPLAKLSAPLVARAAAKLNGASDGEVRADLINLELHLDRADGWIETGAIGGAAPSAADLQVCSGLRLMQTLEDLAPRIDARPCGRLARRVFPDYPGSVPAGTLPAAWLDARAP
ncbi:MAG: glutathione S-transferase [Solirubrobacteraceae bacterium]|nr:glutathione S-transferase [Solirubrobacteraceae bacterium]